MTCKTGSARDKRNRKVAGGFGLLVLAAMLALPATALAPERSPSPEPRPLMDDTTPIAEAAIERALGVAISTDAEGTAEAPARSLRPRSRGAITARASRTARAGQGQSRAAAGGLCGRAGIEGREMAPITASTPGCGIERPVSVTAVDGIRLSRPATLDCDTARAFDSWAREEMRPAMGNRGGGVVRIKVAAHYACRTRNNRPGARVSEHGRGRAIDISGFRLANGERVTILDDYRRGPHARSLQRMHQAACGVFTTTLGPGSDGFHEDHLHFDLAQRRGGATFCR